MQFLNAPLQQIIVGFRPAIVSLNSCRLLKPGWLFVFVSGIHVAGLIKTELAKRQTRAEYFEKMNVLKISLTWIFFLFVHLTAYG